MTKYKIILDEGKPFEVLTTSEKNLKKILKDFYVKNTSETFEHYFNAEVYRFEYGENFKGWIDISETQFIQEIIGEIIDENGIDNLELKCEVCGCLNDCVRFEGSFEGNICDSCLNDLKVRK